MLACIIAFAFCMPGLHGELSLWRSGFVGRKGHNASAFQIIAKQDLARREVIAFRAGPKIIVRPKG